MRTKIKALFTIMVFAVVFASNVALAFYDPNLGRWITRDPIGERGGLNLYRYVHNDPINKVDPFGLNDYNAYLALLKARREAHEAAMRAWADVHFPDPGAVESDPLGDMLLGGIGPALRGSALRSCPVANPIRFGTVHASPHFDGTGLSQSAIENQIRNDIRGQFGNFPTTVEGPFMGRIPFQGQVIEYRGFGLENGTINIGTYYPK